MHRVAWFGFELSLLRSKNDPRNHTKAHE